MSLIYFLNKLCRTAASGFLLEEFDGVSGSVMKYSSRYLPSGVMSFKTLWLFVVSPLAPMLILRIAPVDLFL